MMHSYQEKHFHEQNIASDPLMYNIWLCVANE